MDKRGRLFNFSLLLLAFALTACGIKLNPYSLAVTNIAMPFEAKGITFRDLSYDSRTDRVIIPAGESGNLVLVDPVTERFQVVSGFSTGDPSSEAAASTSGEALAPPSAGAASATSVRGMIFAVDRAANEIKFVDSTSGSLMGSIPVQGTPGEIRFVSATNELWVTESGLEQIEVFQLDDQTPPGIEAEGVISIPDGPEGLLIDRSRGLAYTNQPTIGMTAVIQVQTRGIIDQWGNGCSQARGMTIDEQLGYLFVACAEGKVVVMDVTNDGSQLTSQNYGGDLNAVAYNPTLKHIYVPSGASAILAVFGIRDRSQITPTPLATGAGTQAAVEPTPASTAGAAAEEEGIVLVRLGTADTSIGANCATVDAHNNIWVCDPRGGSLFLIHDTFPASGE